MTVRYGGLPNPFDSDAFDFDDATPQASAAQSPQVSVRYRRRNRRLRTAVFVVVGVAVVSASFFTGWHVDRDTVQTPTPVTVTADPDAPNGVPPVDSAGTEPHAEPIVRQPQ